MAPPKPMSPATDPTELIGMISVGSVIINPDQDCCPKNAMLKSSRAKLTDTCGTKITAGISAALIPSASFLEKFKEYPVFSSLLENQPPRKLPSPDAAYGIHAK